MSRASATGSEEPAVLIIDDNLDLAENLKEVLEEDGLRVTVSGSGRDAMALVPKLRPRVVLTDMRMPGMTGVDVLRGIRERWPRIPVVLLTAYAHDALLDEAREEGVLTVLPKPVDLDRLREVVMRTVAAHANVLVVEDSPEMRVGLTESLQAIDGVVPYAAACAAEALRLCEEVPFRAAVVDLRLPDGDGRAVGDELRTRAGDAAPAVIYVTGYGGDLDEEDRRRLSAGGGRLIEKPVPMEHLLRTLNELLRCDSPTPAS